MMEDMVKAGRVMYSQKYGCSKPMAVRLVYHGTGPYQIRRLFKNGFLASSDEEQMLGGRVKLGATEGASTASPVKAELADCCLLSKIQQASEFTTTALSKCLWESTK